jgi:hypothetical protein
MQASIVQCDIENTGTTEWVYTASSYSEATNLALENACSLILYWMNPEARSGMRRSPEPGGEDEVELKALIAAKKYDEAIELWNEYQNRDGDPEAEVRVFDASVNEPISPTG